MRVVVSRFGSAVSTKVATCAPEARVTAGFCALCEPDVLTVTPVFTPWPVLAASV